MGVQRADAKHQLFEHAYDEADTLLHDRRVKQQLARVLALIKHLLGPEAKARSLLTGVWRTHMHAALLHSYTIACASLELRPQLCPRRSATSGLPRVAGELDQLSPSQQEDLVALVETVFNMTVPLAPVRPPVVHWDSRVRPNGALVGGGPAADAGALWANGTGEPRPDLWVVHPDLVMGGEYPLSAAQALQRANIRRFLAMQVWQLDDHAADWGVILEPEDVRWAPWLLFALVWRAVQVASQRSWPLLGAVLCCRGLCRLRQARAVMTGAHRAAGRHTVMGTLATTCGA